MVWTWLAVVVGMWCWWLAGRYAYRCAIGRSYHRWCMTPAPYLRDHWYAGYQPVALEMWRWVRWGGLISLFTTWVMGDASYYDYWQAALETRDPR